jgi:hypothetical protein
MRESGSSFVGLVWLFQIFRVKQWRKVTACMNDRNTVAICAADRVYDAIGANGQDFSDRVLIEFRHP